VDAHQREMVAKLRNCIKLLNEEFIDITIENITELYEIVVKQNMHAKYFLIFENNSNVLIKGFVDKGTQIFVQIFERKIGNQDS